MKNITIIDYGMGNVQSLYNAVKFLGYKPILFSDGNYFKSNISILPGVGAFNHAMKLINEKKLKKQINNYIDDNSNLLIGICLGMQLFFEKSDENIVTNGLNVIKGNIKRLDAKNNILPNVGWKKTTILRNKEFNYLSKFNNEKFYYVHSYYADPENVKNQIGTSNYNNKEFCALSIKDKNVIGAQFHPEKSSKIGLEFLDCVFKNSIN